MAKRQVFYSFHYQNDVMRVAQIRNIGVIEGNSAASSNDWEEVKRKGDSAIKKWIDDNMKYRSCVIVLIGKETANRKYVKYEIEQAWNSGKGVLGIHIHNINCPRNGRSLMGKNPFDGFTLDGGKKKLSDVVKCYNPNSYDAYNDIAKNIDSWIEEAIRIRNNV
ncbi:TIR domain-containing protein [Aliarcobacter skirrowii]|uniref:TIR domain-containing protein n=1 Tax=Aliarcobacter skirrowii TaxID=28200 RepID=UPI0029ACD72A|nr:TIR domain-containing protein [Aliarcobacter skirrowii]MDX4039639.1 TIR domain-containing protein [Aliarcobacter skirrowii]MDY0328349.1 TIR domain-containing protein [Arcobacteraceae bacterium]